MATGSEMDPDRRVDQTVLAFNDAITRRDIAALGRLMTDDHTFIDSGENVVSGKEAVLGAWRGFFDAFPDYRNVLTEILPSGDAVIALGRSECATEPALDGPAIWAAGVRDNQVCKWRVYDDTPENRALLGLDIASS
jgi:ketosteroid isomerase-like protein